MNYKTRNRIQTFVIGDPILPGDGGDLGGGTEPIVFDVPENYYLEKDKYVENPCGSRNVQRVNLRTAKLYSTQLIHGVSGNRLPFNLTITHNPYYKDSLNIFDDGSTSFTLGKLPFKGWKFNYQQYVRKKDAKYYYYDADFMLHVFAKCQNSSYDYYDSTGQTGMLLSEIRESGIINEIVITDGKNVKLHFSSRGDLIKITEKKGATASEILITYDDSFRISTVTDGAGRAFTFNYESNKIVLTQTNLETPQNIAELNVNTQSQLTSILDCKKQQNITFEYSTSNKFLTSIRNNIENETSSILYINGVAYQLDNYKLIDSVATLKSKIIILGYAEENKTLVQKIFVTNNANVKQKVYYYFAQNGEVIYALQDDEYANEYQTAKINKVKNFFNTHTFANAKAFRDCESILTQDPVLQFTFGDNNGVIQVNSAERKYSDEITLDLQNPSKALLIAKVVTTASQNAIEAGTGSYESDFAKINLSIDNTVIGTINFTDSNLIYKTTIVSIPGSDEDQILKATVINNSTQSLNVEVALYPYTGSEKKELISENNIDESLDAEVCMLAGKTWYEPKKCNIYLNDTAFENVELTYRDYMLTLTSYFKNSTSFTAWYNDGKNAIAGCSLGTLKYLFRTDGSGTQKQLTDFQYAIYQKGINRASISYAIKDSSYLKFATETALLDSSVTTFTKLDSYFRPVTQQDENGIITAYSYDAYGNCTQQKVYPSSDTSEYITQNYTYTNGDQLASEKDYRGISTFTTSYSYDADGKLIKVTTPKSEQINYEYNSSDLLSKLSSGSSANNLVYSGGLLNRCNSGGADYLFNYNKFNDVTSVTQSGFNLHQNNVVYNADGSGCVTVTYGNGYLEEQHFDKYGHVNQIIKKENGTIAEKIIIIYSDNELGSNVKTLEHTDIQLSANSKLRKMVDKYGNVVYNCKYDIFGNITELEDENNVIQSCLTDELGRLKEEIITEDKAVLVTRNLSYKNDSTSIINSEAAVVKIGGTEKGKIQTDYAKDGLNRPTSTTVKDGANNGYKVTYGYYPKEYQERVTLPPIISPGGTIIPGGFQIVTTPDGTTGYIQTVTTNNINAGTETLSKTETVVYDANGNITQYGGNTYVYDNLNRLIRENSADIGETFTYEYDIHGNLTAKKEYAYTTAALGTATSTKTFTHDSNNKLTINNGSAVTYDGAGNITSISGKTFNWKGSRISLASDSRGTSTIFYKDNGNLNEIVFEANNNNINFASRGFSYLNGQLYCDESGFCKLYYVYNEQGIAGFYLSNKAASYFFKEGLYTFRKNIFGDITDIYYGSTRVASYKYDAWGNCTVENFPLEGTDEDFSIGNLNPFRYRGYYWCEALQMYHLQTRWYDPTIGRFISPDSYEYLDPETFGGLNLYAYCLNNPIMYIDPTGHGISLTFCIVVGLSAVLAGASSMATQYFLYDSIDWWEVAISAGFGALTAALSLIGIGGVWGQFAIQGSLSVAEDLTIAAYNNELNLNNIGLDGLVSSFLISGALGMIGAKSAANEFRRIRQIEKSMFRAIKSQAKNMFKGLVKTTGKEISRQLGKKSGKKLVIDVLKPTIKELFIEELVNFFIDYSFEVIF